jgi:hypothetical protein
LTVNAQHALLRREAHSKEGFIMSQFANIPGVDWVPLRSLESDRLSRPEFLRRRRIKGIDLIEQFKDVGAEDRAVAALLDDIVNTHVEGHLASDPHDAFAAWDQQNVPDRFE